MTTLVGNLLALLMLTSGLTGSVPGSAPAPVADSAVRPAPGSSAGTPRTSVVPGMAAPTVGMWPLRPRPTVVTPFDPPLTRYGSGHRGVDLAGRAGQKVRAAVAGRVTFAGSLAGRSVVVVTHGASRTTYEPVKAEVKVGALVGAGEVLGTLQPFASHCAPAVCLHWGLIEGETYLDPLTLVGRGPVRLLPLFGGMSGRPPGAGRS